MLRVDLLHIELQNIYTGTDAFENLEVIMCAMSSIFCQKSYNII